MTDDLDTKTDANLSEIFAVEVAGWTFTLGTVEKWWRDGDGDFRGAGFINLPHFATSADAVLPWMEVDFLGKHGNCDMDYRTDSKEWRAHIYTDDGDFSVGSISPKFARTACIARIRAEREKRAQKGAEQP